MKKIMNGVNSIIDELCEGIAGAHPELSLIANYRIIRRKEIDSDKVVIISGGSSGHEPSDVGFVGRGMLSAAVCGEIFNPPSTIQVYNTIMLTQTKKGTLLIIKNYPGDRMNFEAAAEMAREDGVLAESVYVNDDKNGQRGSAGAIFVHKIAGAAAEAGMELSEVKRIAQKTIDNVRTISLVLKPYTMLSGSIPALELPENEAELGVGMHGEPGIRRLKIKTANEYAAQMIKKLMNEFSNNTKGEFAFIVNGLGGTMLMELYLFSNCVDSILKFKKIKAYKILVGNYMTSLDMAGISLTVLKLDDELKNLLDAPVNTPAFRV